MSYQKIKIELSESNERKFREIHQFIHKDISFEQFINNWISEVLHMEGF